MKLARLSLALFLFFVAVLSGVRYVDAQSIHYVICVRHLAAEAESPFLYPADKQKMLESLDDPDADIQVNGQTCPPILKAHKQDIRARVKDS